MKQNLKPLPPPVQHTGQEYREQQERTRLERYIQQLRRFEAIGRLSGGIVHDFNNMIGAILGWAELGCEESEPGTRVHARFQKIRDQSQRAAELTSQLLSFGRPQVLETREVDLNVLIQEEMSFLESAIGENIQVRILGQPDLCLTRADPTQLRQVLMNLCLNARDAMPSGGQLTIQTRNFEVTEEFCRKHVHATCGFYVSITVTDTGVGMDTDMAKRVFEPFFTTKEIGRGTGLGLATVWGIVRQHQGFLCIETKPGEGSSFQVYLPAESEVRAPVEMVGAQHPLTGSETILLVEDHDALRDSAQEMLQSLGYRIILASDGRNAVNLFRQYADQIDLVVMDVIMPLKGGVDAYLELSEMRPSVGVIFTSGYTTKSEPLITLLERGAMFVQKPYDLSTLNQMIRRALDHKRPH